MKLAALLLMAAAIFVSTVVSCYRAGLLVGAYLVRIHPDVGAWVGILAGIAMALWFLHEHDVLTLG